MPQNNEIPREIENVLPKIQKLKVEMEEIMKTLGPRSFGGSQASVIEKMKEEQKMMNETVSQLKMELREIKKNQNEKGSEDLEEMEPSETPIIRVTSYKRPDTENQCSSSNMPSPTQKTVRNGAKFSFGRQNVKITPSLATSPLIQFYIKHLDGHGMIEMNPKATLDQVMQKVETMLGYSSDQYEIYYQEKRLIDIKKPLDALGITHGSVVTFKLVQTD